MSGGPVAITTAAAASKPGSSRGTAHVARTPLEDRRNGALPSSRAEQEGPMDSPRTPDPLRESLDDAYDALRLIAFLDVQQFPRPTEEMQRIAREVFGRLRQRYESLVSTDPSPGEPR
jgi:hypothetical protein